MGGWGLWGALICCRHHGWHHSVWLHKRGTQWSLRAMLERTRQRGIKLNKDKSIICVTKVNYLGHTLTQEGVRPDPNKVTAIKDMATPQSKAELETIFDNIGHHVPVQIYPQTLWGNYPAPSTAERGQWVRMELDPWWSEKHLNTGARSRTCLLWPNQRCEVAGRCFQMWFGSSPAAARETSCIHVHWMRVNPITLRSKRNCTRALWMLTIPPIPVRTSGDHQIRSQATGDNHAQTPCRCTTEPPTDDTPVAKIQH